LTEKNVWTINSEFVNIFEEETMFYVKNNEEVMKTAMRDPGTYDINTLLII